MNCGLWVALKKRQVSVVVNPLNTLSIEMPAIVAEPSVNISMATVHKNLYVDFVPHLFSDSFGHEPAIMEVDIGWHIDPWAHGVRKQFFPNLPKGLLQFTLHLLALRIETVKLYRRSVTQTGRRLVGLASSLAKCPMYKGIREGKKPISMNRTFMRSLLVEESFAYGFTIAFSGSGLLLVSEYGLLGTVGIMEYALGAVTGFGLLALVTFGGVVNDVDVTEPPTYFVLAGIHYLSGLVPIMATHLLLALALGKGLTLFVAGALVSILYNLFAALEEAISELAWAIEQRYSS